MGKKNAKNQCNVSLVTSQSVQSPPIDPWGKGEELGACGLSSTT